MGACLADTHHICQTMSAFEVVLGVYIVIAVFHAIVATFATLACIVYVLSTIAERSRIHWKHVGIAVAMVGLSAVFYVALFSQVRFPNLFDSERWPPSTFQFRGAWSLWFYFESFCIIFAAWFKVGCSVDAWRRMPAESEVVRFRDQYEFIKGHRDFVVMMCLRGTEPLDQVVASIASVLESDFPKHRLRLVMVFHGDDTTATEQCIHRTFLTSANAGQDGVPQQLSPIENCMSKQSVRVSMLRYGPVPVAEAQTRAMNLMSVIYEDDAHYRPIICLLHHSVLLSKLTIAHFVYDLDDPHCDALAGMVIDDGRRFTPARFVQSLDFMDDIVEPIAEQYAGNVTEMPCMMTATKFKAMRTINAIKGRDEASILDKNKVAMALMRSNYTRHRAGVCLGAAASHQDSAESIGAGDVLANARDRFISGTFASVNAIMDRHAWEVSPGLCVLKMIGALMNPHTALYTEIFLLEYITGRGTRFACAYIFLLFIPCYIFIVTFAAQRFRKFHLVLSLPVNLILNVPLSFITDLNLIRYAIGSARTPPQQ